ncbi:MAG TPA: hypothetical protein VGH38_33440 [Bryobacteraceae bacterium]
MKLKKVFCLVVFGATCAAQADTLSRVITPPYYTDAGRLEDGTPYYFHDDQWAAFAFLRLPSCVPTDFNLLDGADFEPAFPNGPPRVFGCPLTIDGQAIFQNPNDFVPVQANLKGLGAVPIWFVKLTDVQAALGGNKLTITQLLAMPSLRKGSNLYGEVDQPGVFRPQGEGNGSIQVTASGSLEDGTSFQFEWRDMGKKDGNGQDFVRHVRIAFK